MAATVLVVDDDVAVMRPLVVVLALEGCAHHRAERLGGADYLRGGRDADVILLELRMPVMEGWGSDANSWAIRPSRGFRSSCSPGRTTIAPRRCTPPPSSRNRSVHADS